MIQSPYSETESEIENPYGYPEGDIQANRGQRTSLVSFYMIAAQKNKFGFKNAGFNQGFVFMKNSR